MSFANDVYFRVVYGPLPPLISVVYHTAIGCLERFQVSRLRKYGSNEATCDAQCTSEGLSEALGVQRDTRPWVCISLSAPSV